MASDVFDEIAAREGVSADKLEKRVKSGFAVVLRNVRRDINPIAIGEGVHVKINANIGTSPEVVDLNLELAKAEAAVEYGADTVMDLSIGGDLDEIRRLILKNVDVPVGTVPVYQAFLEQKLDMSPEYLLKVVEKHCRDGVDFITLHCGITLNMLDKLGSRIIPLTSRGGSFLAAWMIKNKAENPLYENFDEILEIVKEYEVVISLGDAMRPACIHDASDYGQIQELLNLGRLTKKARSMNVPVIIEGPGHIPLDQIEYNVKLEKKICDNAPFYVLGPLVTDIAVGHDHITGAIGGAVAAMYGADFLCYVTPSEHLGLPSVEDVKAGVLASKIAAHAADIVRLRDTRIDDDLSHARRDLDWDKMFMLALDRTVGDTFKTRCRHSECSMCGRYCALKIIKEYLNEEV